MRTTHRRNRPGFTLPVAILLMLAVLVIGAAAFELITTGIQTERAHQTLATGDFSAESMVRIMSDRLVARAEQNLGMITGADIAALNAEIAALPVPAGSTIDVSRTKYSLAAVTQGDVVPYDQDALKVVPDAPRVSFTDIADPSGVTSARTVEVEMVAAVRKGNEGFRAAVARLEISKVLPHQRALQGSGDLEICVSAGSNVVIQGRVRADGSLISRCPGARTYTGELYAAKDIQVQDNSGSNHVLETAGGAIPLTSLARAGAQADVAGTLSAFGGRVKLGSALGDRYATGGFQSQMTAGSGECEDFTGACAGASMYNPSVLVQKVATDANNSNVELTCGAAWTRAGNPSGCQSLVTTGALTYTRYPFAGTPPTGAARQDGGAYWTGLFPDPRRQSRCDATVNGAPVRTYRCDTAPYGYVLDLAKAPPIEGGFLSVRKTARNAGVYNPSGWQEWLVIKNADVLYRDLTIHSEIPVAIEGNFNTSSPRAAMIDAPLVTMLPADADAQLRGAAAWDSSATVAPKALRAAGQVAVYGVLRTKYQLSEGANYYGGSLEAAPAVLGNWSKATLELHGAIEGRPWAGTDVAPYKTAFRPYSTEPADVRTVQPGNRVVEYTSDLGTIGAQPPGSFSAANMPLSATGSRTAARQANAFGGATVMRVVQEPTRVPMASAADTAFADSMGFHVSPDAPPTIVNFTCSPTAVLTGDDVACQGTLKNGSNPLTSATLTWEDGVSVSPPLAGLSVSGVHAFASPGTYPVKLVAYDSKGIASAPVTISIVVSPRPPVLDLAASDCTPTVVKPSNPSPPGDDVTCRIKLTQGTYPIVQHSVSWGDGVTTAVGTASGDATYTHQYTLPNGVTSAYFTAKFWATDRGGLSTVVDSTVIYVRHLPGTIALVCSPKQQEPTKDVTCTATTTDGTTPMQTVRIDWGDGAITSTNVVGGLAVLPHAYHTGSETAANDRRYTINGTATDLAGLQATAQDYVDIKTVLPTAAFNCDKSSIYTGEAVGCYIKGTAGTFAAKDYHFDWVETGSTPTVVTSGSASDSLTASHTFVNPGAPWVLKGWVTDTRGNSSAVQNWSVTVANFRPWVITYNNCPATLYVGWNTACTWNLQAGTRPIVEVVGLNYGHPATNTADLVVDQADWDVQIPQGWVNSPVNGTRAGADTTTVRLRDDLGNYYYGPWKVVSISGTPPPPPTGISVSLSCNPTSFPAGGGTTTCTATATPAAGDGVKSYSTNTGSNSTTTATTYSFPATVAATQNVCVTATATSGATAQDCKNITVSTGGPALAVTSVVCSTVNVGQATSCSATAQPDAHAITGWTWDWGDGTSSNGGSSASHTYADAGSYSVTATVQDNGGDDASLGTTANVTVAVGGGITCSASLSATDVNKTDQVQLNVGWSGSPTIVTYTASGANFGSGSAMSGSVNMGTGNLGSTSVSVHVSDGVNSCDTDAGSYTVSQLPVITVTVINPGDQELGYPSGQAGASFSVSPSGGSYTVSLTASWPGGGCSGTYGPTGGSCTSLPDASGPAGSRTITASATGGGALGNGTGGYNVVQYVWGNCQIVASPVTGFVTSVDETDGTTVTVSGGGSVGADGGTLGASASSNTGSFKGSMGGPGSCEFESCSYDIMGPANYGYNHQNFGTVWQSGWSTFAYGTTDFSGWPVSAPVTIEAVCYWGPP